MDARTSRRGANTVTVQNNPTPPAYIPRAALMLSLVAALIAIVTQFTRIPMPIPSIRDPPPATNISSVSDLIKAVFDAPQRGHFFPTGCLSGRGRSLVCHTLQDVSYVLDDVDVSDDGESYVFRITKRRVRNMRRDVLLRRERLDGCTPWHHGSFFMKLDWFLLYYLPRSIASRVFGTAFTQGGFRRDRWGWCSETIPFGTQHIQPTQFDRDGLSKGHKSSSYAPMDELSRKPNANGPPSKHETDRVLRDSPSPASQQEKTYRDNPVNHEAHLQQNIMYAR